MSNKNESLRISDYFDNIEFTAAEGVLRLDEIVYELKQATEKQYQLLEDKLKLLEEEIKLLKEQKL